MEGSLRYTLQELNQAVSIIQDLMKHYSIITFTGSIGAGKTTLIKKVLLSEGITEPITSPTYSYVSIYQTSQGKKIFHFDLYRIVNLEQFMQFGFDEYLTEPGSWSFIEWPEVVQPLLSSNACRVTIDYEGNDARLLRYSPYLQNS